jgi:hypothetical protein
MADKVELEEEKPNAYYYDSLKKIGERDGFDSLNYGVSKLLIESIISGRDLLKRINSGEVNPDL